MEGLVDTGGFCTIMDVGTARDLGLKVQKAEGTEFGMFISPGSTTPIPYPAAVIGPVSLQLDEEVVVQLPHIRLVEHGKELFIIGADVLCEEVGEDEWAFVGLGPG